RNTPFEAGKEYGTARRGRASVRDQEMPKLDHLYKERKERGLVVFGLSAEDAETQEKFLAKAPVSYPLLTMTEGVPDFYRDVARYPALFLVDRDGQLQPLSESGESFTSIEAA